MAKHPCNWLFKGSAMRGTFMIIAATVGLSACATFPEVDARTAPEVQSASYPALLPVDDLRAEASTGPLEQRDLPLVATLEEDAEQIDNRASSLRARAASLRGDVIDEADRERLDQEITIDDEEV
ncbi:MAG: hypothetical protein AAF641_01505 [Pseudomonadota bacterium]